MNWMTISRKSGEHLRATYDNTRQLFRVSSAVYTVISPTGDRTSDRRCETLPLRHQRSRNYHDSLVWYHSCTMWTGGSLIDLQWEIWRYTQLMRPKKVETAVQCFCKLRAGVRRIFWLWLFNSQFYNIYFISLRSQYFWMFAAIQSV